MFLSPAFDLRKRGRLACRGQLRSGLMSEACCAPCGLLDDLAHGRPRGLWPTYVNQPNGLRCLVQICKADFSADAGGTARPGSRNTSACTKQKKVFFCIHTDRGALNLSSLVVCCVFALFRRLLQNLMLVRIPVGIATDRCIQQYRLLCAVDLPRGKGFSGIPAPFFIFSNIFPFHHLPTVGQMRPVSTRNSYLSS